MKFNKEDHFYTKNQKAINNILIWVIPFLWIMLMKAANATALGLIISKEKEIILPAATGSWEAGTVSLTNPVMTLAEAISVVVVIQAVAMEAVVATEIKR